MQAPRPSHQSMILPVKPDSYVGVYAPGVPDSYASVTKFTAQIHIQPRIVVYYSGWFEPFKAGFATTVADHGAVPLVQIDPKNINLAAIASGHYDAYLTSYAQAVRSYHHPVILCFGHEMNGDWYSWGYRHTPPQVFVAAWRHIVTLFRELGAQNATWLWTVNIVRPGGSISRPALWWPGRKYVTWVGLDGYYYKPSWAFAPLFGPTITAIRELTHAPILITETSVSPATNQPAKIADLDVAVDSEHRARRRQYRPSGTLVARQQVRDVGRPGRLLLQAVLGVRSAVRADHRGHTPVHPRSDAHS